MKQLRSFAAVLLLFSGCMGSETHTNQQQTDPPLVDPAVAASYSEASEAGNGNAAGSEVTGYTLDDKGLIISAAFEAGSPTVDTFRFNTGGYSRIHVQTYVNGVKQVEANFVVSLRMQSFIDDGYSALLGSGYFINASLSSSGDFLIGVFPAAGAAGLSYTVQLVGAP
jgi:hypothetical protein